MIHEISDTTRHLIACALGAAIKDAHAKAAHNRAIDEDEDADEYERAANEMTILQDDIAGQDDCMTITT